MMRRLWIGASLVGLMVLSAAVGAWGATSARKQIEVEYKQIQITVDGKPVTVEAGSEPFLYLEKGRVFVPARYLAEALGSKVGWDGATNTVQVYTREYASVTAEGDQIRWSMPANGFSIKTAKGFVRQPLPTALLQVALPHADGTASVLAVSRLPADPMPAAEKMQLMLMTLTQTFLPEAQVADAVEAEGMLTTYGSAKLFGQIPSVFAIRIISSPEGDWMLMTAQPTAQGEKLAPALQESLDSFTQL